MQRTGWMSLSTLVAAISIGACGGPTSDPTNTIDDAATVSAAAWRTDSAQARRGKVPGVPGTPTFSNVADTTLTVTWTSAPRANSYQLERAPDGGGTPGTYAAVVTGSTGTSYDDTGLTAGATYWYRVTGIDSAGNGPYSADASVTTTSAVTAPVTAPAPACTYTYSDWSTCQSDGTQTRTVTSSSPAGCTGTPVLSQSCTYTTPTSTATSTSNPWPVTGTNALYVSSSGSDTNPGTSALPFRQVSRAAQVATAGTVVHVAPGTYGCVTSSQSGSSWSAPVTFVSDQKWGAVINCPGQTTAWSNSGQYVVIQGFEITGANYQGILTTSSHGRFRGNHIHHLVTPDCSRGGGGVVTENYSETDNDADGNVIHDIAYNLSSCGLIHGVYLQGPYGGNVTNNLVYRIGGWGVHLYHNANHIVIANNTVFTCKHAGIIVGASLEGNDQPPGIDTGTTVVNNIVVGNATGCIEENNSGRTYGNTYIDNTCYANGGGNTIALLAPPAGQPWSTVTGTLTSDPQFVNYQPDGSGDYRLQSASPSANSGTGTDAPAYDIDLFARPAGSAVDRGAYESW